MNRFRLGAAIVSVTGVLTALSFGRHGVVFGDENPAAPSTAGASASAPVLNKHPTYAGAMWVTVPLRPGLKNGWRQSIPVRTAEPRAAQYDVWLKDGWFYVRLSDEDGKLEWQIKLASQAEMGTPVISRSHPTGGEFEVRSENGRFFVRDLMYSLRSVRQLSELEGAMPRTEFFDETFATDLSLFGDGLVRSTASEWHNAAWHYVGIGPERDQFNCVVRLCPVEPLVRGAGSGGLNELKHFVYGEAELWDDGEMLFAVRKLPAKPQAAKPRNRERKTDP